MEVTKRGKVNYPGDVNVKGVLISSKISTDELDVGANATLVDLNVTGKTVLAGDASVNGVLEASKVSTNNLEVKNNVTVTKDLNVTGKTVLSGDLVVTGNILNDKDEKGAREEFENGEIYFGNKSQDGTWRIRVDDGELLIEKLEDHEWEIKQSMS